MTFLREGAKFEVTPLPGMTLNGHFALKSVSGSATNGLASPAFGQNCSKICRVTHILSATIMSPK